MSRFLRNNALVLFLFLLFRGSCYPQDIDVCLWKGRDYQSALPALRRKYPGSFTVKRLGGQSVIINRLDLETYLAGVLSKEMDSLWPSEALKAQAVLSRTFAVNKINENRHKSLPYDIENSIYHQVYGSAGCARIEEAVLATRGEVLSSGGDIGQVFFHASCGGRTATPEEVWGGKYDLIKSVDDPYCEGTPYHSWIKRLSLSYISRAVVFPDLAEIEISSRSVSGRINNLKLISKNGIIRHISAHRFRMEINSKAPRIAFNEPFVIPGTNFTINREGETLIFSGAGYGHGVGMCQWGARRMADSGKNYREILSHYFPAFSLGICDYIADTKNKE